MGTLISKNPTLISHPLLIEYRKLTHEQVEESFQNLKDVHAKKNFLTESEFDEVFGFWMGDSEPHFKFWANFKGRVDCFEIFCGCIVFAQGNLNDKIEFIFHFCDLDDSNSMNIDEMTILIMSCARGMCRLAQLEAPIGPDCITEIEAVSRAVFTKALSKEEREISCESFKQWVLNNHSIMEYIERFTGGTNILAAVAKRNAFLAECDEYFLRTEDGFQTITHVQLMDFIKQQLKNASSFELGHISKNLGTRRITKPLFDNVMSSLIAFDIADTNELKSITTKQLRALLWLMHGKEPADRLVDYEMKQLDADCSGEVSRMEFIAYMSVDPSTRDASQILEAGLKTSFDKYDEGTGFLSREQFGAMVKETIAAQFGMFLKNSGKDLMDSMLHDSTNELLQFIDPEQSGQVNWLSLKKHAALICNKELEIIQWAKEFMIDHVQRLLSFDKENAQSLNIVKLNNVLSFDLDFHVQNKQISPIYARELAKEFAFKIFATLNLDPSSDIMTEDFLNQHWQKILKLEREMTDLIISHISAADNTAQNLMMRLQAQGIKF